MPHEIRHRLWIVEIWEDIRPTFKALIADCILFLLIVGILRISELAISNSALAEGKAEILKDFHFLLLLVCLAVLSVALIATLLRTIKKNRED